MIAPSRSHTQAVCFRFNRRGHAVRINGFRKAWNSACIKAGLGKMEPKFDEETGKIVYANPRGDRKNPKPKAKMVYKGTIFHDLRRSGFRNLVRAGVPEGIAMKITGHKTRSVFERYNIVSPTDVRDASRKLGVFHSQKVEHISNTIEGTLAPHDSLLN
jgi:integrase